MLIYDLPDFTIHIILSTPPSSKALMWDGSVDMIGFCGGTEIKKWQMFHIYILAYSGV